DLLGILLTRSVGGAHDGACGRSAGAHDDPGALADDVAFVETGIADCLVHGDVIPAHARLHEATRFARNHAFPFNMRRTVHLAAEAKCGVLGGGEDAGFASPEGATHLLGTIPEGGDAPHPRHAHAAH